MPGAILVRRWLTLVCLMIMVMVVVGGVTRLTGSGLSIPEWAPIMGAIPPHTDSQWQSAFERYQATPHYQKANFGMGLAEFKWIFFWEYLHRLLGRLIGLVYFLPFMVLWRAKKIPPRFMRPLWLGLFLGGLQGLVGWLMVKSGLIDLPRVSHLRLALHLGLALTVLVYLSWLRWDLKCWDLTRRNWPASDKTELMTTEARAEVRQWSAMAVLLSLQIVYGAFVAGLRAGFIYNTFPKMGEEWIPASIGAFRPLVLDLIENPITVQFIHRILGITLVIAITLLVIRARSRIQSRDRRRKRLLVLHLVWIQVGLGIVTLVTQVPLVLGALHQLTACLLLLSVFHLIHNLRIKDQT